MKFLLIGGLGDSIHSLQPWIDALVLRHHQYQYIKVAVNKTSKFDDRMQTLRNHLFLESRKVCIIGQSAGGLAALLVARDHPSMVKGVIAVSPAMPRGISPMSLSLLSVMWKYYYHMVRDHLIEVTAEDYTRLALNGVSLPHINNLLKNRGKISGREAYELATDSLRPNFDTFNAPVVHVYGKKDPWINPRAQHKLYKLLGNNKASIVVDDAGHLPAHHRQGEETVRLALQKLSELLVKSSS